ncbi:hypothetical protein [uncultured Mucilaginibacter sp.]|uniref:hypothetical protein n=1 Tax=uncultured Mucilaginibacter sp. TaxID=797541 RepID=UPI0025D52F11|nr:hypothetical protein [uncultured Mucilaginibacter sp.]
MLQFIRKLSLKIGIDGAIAYTLLSRVLQAGGGVISILFITRFLSAEEQGYYYTFASILAIHVFFELGLSGIITQYAAHEFAHLNWTDDNTLEGEDYYKSRLSSLLHFCVKWFALISVILFFSLTAIGLYFFKSYNHNINVNWQGPWIILSLSTGLNLFIDPLLAYFEGIGAVKDISKVRFIQKAAYIGLLFLFFFLGLKLYSTALASLCAILINYIQILLSKRFYLLKHIWHLKTQWIINYTKEILPYQWRIALSWISGYFMFQLFNPVLFATEGAKVAGQMGMSLQVLNGISALSMSWINTKIPLFSNLIAKEQYIKLDQMFNETLRSLMSINGLMSLVFVLIIIVLKLYNIFYNDRFLDIIPTIALTSAMFLYQLIFSWAAYLRCHKTEPLLIYSIGMGILTSLSTFIFGHLYGVLGITIGYCLITILISLPWVAYVFYTKKREWHVIIQE